MKHEYEKVVNYIKNNYKEISFWNVSEGNNEDVPTEISIKDLNGILHNSFHNEFFKVDRNEYPEWTGYGVTPYRVNAYLFIHLDLVEDIKKIDIFISIDEYPTKIVDRLPSEIGILNNFVIFKEKLPFYEFKSGLDKNGYCSYIVMTRSDRDNNFYCVSLRSTK